MPPRRRHVRLFLPIIGMLELTYGYNYDAFPSVEQQGFGTLVEPSWRFQFSLGQGFGQ